MKKISTLILAMAVAAGVATAAPFVPTVKTGHPLEVKTLSVKKSTSVASDKAIASFAPNSKMHNLSELFSKSRKVVAKAEGAEAETSIEGDYTIGIGDYYLQGGAGAITVDGSIELFDYEGTQFAIVDSDYFVTEVAGEYDEAAQTVTFYPTPLGEVQLQGGTTAYMSFMSFEYVYDEDEGSGSVIPAEFSITFDPATGEFDIPVDHGFGWAAFSDEEYSEILGWFDIFDLESLVKQVPDTSTWTNVGNAIFEDAWVSPCFGVAGAEIPYEVALEQNDDNKNLFRLVNPYGSAWPLFEEGCTESEDGAGYIQFDLSDPDHVLFKAVNSGWVFSALGVTQFYCIDEFLFYIGNYGFDPADVIEYLSDYIVYTTYKDGVVTIPSVYEIDEESGEEVCHNAACFGIQGAKYAGYGWTDQNSNTIEMAGKITFPAGFDFVPETNQSGLGNIIADADANAPVEFFNLQGVKVENPENGLYIRRQGKTVSKVVVRK